MDRPALFRSVFCVCVASLLATTAVAQGLPQAVAPGQQQPQDLATGYRISKIIGTQVVNETNELIGIIDDLIVTRPNNAVFAVISVGGFLGIGSKLVIVLYNSLKPADSHMVLPGATKKSLQAMPPFHYAI